MSPAISQPLQNNVTIVFPLPFDSLDDLIATEFKKQSAQPIQLVSHKPSNNSVLALIHRIFTHIRKNQYQLGANIFNLSKGIFQLDCSEYLNHLLALSNPRAYQELHQSTKNNPTSLDYFDFISRFTPNKIHHHWLRLQNLSEAQAGDVLVFRYKNLFTHQTAGHVMVLTDTPKRLSWLKNAYAVQVSDSAPARHSHDTRLKHQSGIGIGVLLLKIDPKTKQPIAYAWRKFSLWHTDMFYLLARPR